MRLRVLLHAGAASGLFGLVTSAPRRPASREVDPALDILAPFVSNMVLETSAAGGDWTISHMQTLTSSLSTSNETLTIDIASPSLYISAPPSGAPDNTTGNNASNEAPLNGHHALIPEVDTEASSKLAPNPEPFWKTEPSLSLDTLSTRRPFSTPISSLTSNSTSALWPTSTPAPDSTLRPYLTLEHESTPRPYLTLEPSLTQKPTPAPASFINAESTTMTRDRELTPAEKGAIAGGKVAAFLLAAALTFVPRPTPANYILSHPELWPESWRKPEIDPKPETDPKPENKPNPAGVEKVATDVVGQGGKAVDSVGKGVGKASKGAGNSLSGVFGGLDGQKDDKKDDKKNNGNKKKCCCCKVQKKPVHKEEEKPHKKKKDNPIVWFFKTWAKGMKMW